MTKIRSVQTRCDNLRWHPTFSAETYVLQRRKQQKTHNNQMRFTYIKEHAEIVKYKVQDCCNMRMTNHFKSTVCCQILPILMRFG